MGPYIARSCAESFAGDSDVILHRDEEEAAGRWRHGRHFGRVTRAEREVDPVRVQRRHVYVVGAAVQRGFLRSATPGWRWICRSCN